MPSALTSERWSSGFCGVLVGSGDGLVPLSSGEWGSSVMCWILAGVISISRIWETVAIISSRGLGEVILELEGRLREGSRGWLEGTAIYELDLGGRVVSLSLVWGVGALFDWWMGYH